MSYIQIEIGGRLRGLKYNTLAIKEFLRTTDFEKFEDTANYAMVWAGLYANCYVKMQEPDFTFEDVVEWCESLTQQQFDDISNVMASVEAYKRLLPKSEVITETSVEKKKRFREYDSSCLKIALGRLKWSEYEYYTSSPEAFYYACEGYFDERQDLERWIRQSSYIGYRVMGGKENSPNRIWPMFSDKKVVKDLKVWGDTPDDLIKNAMKIHKIDGI